MSTPGSPLVNFSTLENLKYQISVCSCHFDSAAISHEQEIYRQSTSSGLLHLDQSREVLHDLAVGSLSGGEAVEAARLADRNWHELGTAKR